MNKILIFTCILTLGCFVYFTPVSSLRAQEASESICPCDFDMAMLQEIVSSTAEYNMVCQFKIWNENAKMSLTGDPQEQANLLMKMAQTRVEEMSGLDEGPEEHSPVMLMVENAKMALTGDPQEGAELLMQMEQSRTQEMDGHMILWTVDYTLPSCSVTTINVIDESTSLVTNITLDQLDQCIGLISEACDLLMN